MDHSGPTCTVGVLALQGAFRAHAEQLADLGCVTREVRTPADLAAVDALVMPGGESTAMSNLLRTSGLDVALAARLAGDMPVLATCAGLILLADTVLDGRPDQLHFGALAITARRNGYGRQRDSFETDLTITGFDAPFHGVFIRAPRIEAVGEDVEVLAVHDGDPVLVRHGAITAATFHPELAGDARVHAAFVTNLTSPAHVRPTAVVSSQASEPARA